MRGNSFGNLFTVTSFGESHGNALGVVIDGVPAGLNVNFEDLSFELDKRRPGRLDVSTNRNESDTPEILSGVFENKTIGSPICVIVKNKDQRSQDYDSLKTNYRPGHADKTTEQKFGHRDHRGGGRSSGRETLSRVIAGYFASLLIPNIEFTAMIKEVGPFKTEQKDLDRYKYNDSQIGFACPKKDEDLRKYLLNLKQNGNSIGGSVYLKIENCPTGLGEPVFDKLKSDLAKGMMSIGSCMGVQFGRGSEFATLTGSEISTDSSNFSGIEGGISNGETIYLEAFFKAPSTIGEKAKEGRHDPCILPRVLPVVESMAKIVVADHFLRQNAFQL
ncbi:MAG: chorismate synthase [Bacteriovoracaceae bacterium]|jgi:chorismate synthase